MKINIAMKRIIFLIIAAVAVAASCCGPKDGEYTLRILTTNDVHGHYFDSLYTSDQTGPSMMALAWYIDSVRVAAGKENVVLIDAGDSMHGDNASYFFNYVDTETEHVFARMLEYLDYDAWIPGNHDFETGHPVYDRVVAGLDVPVLAANAIRVETGESYFREYVIVKRHGLKIAIVGFTNPNIENAYEPVLWSGIDFESLIPDFTQNVVNRVREKENPDVVIVAIHSGAGRGDGSQLEQQGLDLFKSLEGVDVIVSAHDHRVNAQQSETIAMVNTGNYCSNLGYATVTVTVENGKVTGKKVSAELIPVDKDNVDEEMKSCFQADYAKVKAYTTRPVGELKTDLNGSDALAGMSDYVNLLHTICLNASEAQVSFAAPLSPNVSVKAGKMVYNDLFTLYPYENELYEVKMTGKEIKSYLEHSYDGWINTLDKDQEHILKMRGFTNPRTGNQMWFFAATASNLDSAGGLVYDVDVTKPVGERIIISSFADGSAFDESAEYKVAMTSYRARGGGELLEKAGVDTKNIEERMTGRYADIRSLIDAYLAENGEIASEAIGDKSLIGEWKFIPEAKARKVLDQDVKLVAPRR